MSDDDLSALSEQDDQEEKQTKVNAKTSHTEDDTEEEEVEEIIEEVDDDDFEIPDDENIETIEEIIEDDTIDEEQVEEYYEEIIDEEEEEDEHPKVSIYGSNHSGKYDDDVEIENTDEDAAYPVFKAKDNGVDIPNISGSPELPIDVFEMHNEIVLRILVPGITPENLKVSITRDHVSLSCTRPAPEGIKESSYFEREIPYGNFDRMIHLPSDVEVEKAEAVEKYGLLIIRLPKLDAKKVQELKIKSV